MFIATTDEGKATGPVADYFARQRAAWGFLPNYAQCFAARPDVAATWGVLGQTIRDGMDRRRFEIATIAAALARRSTYCATAHTKFLRDVCRDDATVAAIAADPSGGALAGADQAVFRFSDKLARDAASIEQADVDALRVAGLDDSDIVDVVLAVAARAFFTTVLDGLGARLDAQTAAEFAPRIRAAMLVGRPPASTPSP